MRCIFPNLFMGCSHVKIGLMGCTPVKIWLEIKKYFGKNFTISKELYNNHNYQKIKPNPSQNISAALKYFILESNNYLLLLRALFSIVGFANHGNHEKTKRYIYH